MVDLRKMPFYLKEDDIKWVEETLASLSSVEKLHQIMVEMVWNDSPATLGYQVRRQNFGGYRYNNQKSDKIYKQNQILQSGKIPALIAANIESGGDGAVSKGTRIGQGIAIAATENPKNAYYLGYYGCQEAAAVGCNWTFAPVVDVNFNWRNCVIPNRCFGNNADRVLEMSLEYFKGASDAGVACCMKHFPGDGCDERDQHLATTINDLSCEEWDNSFGKIYKGMIEAGVQSVMVGHIMQPAYSRALRPDIKDEEIMPATLSPELIHDLLREKLGFNGLVITDATHMLGLTSAKKRCEALPEMIMNGCDMILFYRDKKEDLDYLKEALIKKTLTTERLDEAVRTVLGFKAMLGLHKGNLMSPKSELEIIGCEQHKNKEKEIIDQSITLVKNKGNNLPINPETHPKVIVFQVENNSILKVINQEANIGSKFIEVLEQAGFVPTLYRPNPLKYLSPKGIINGKKAMNDVNIKNFKENYDLAIIIANISDFATTNSRNLKWTIPMGFETPWYVTEIPTIAISVAHPFHLIDIPMVPTYINTYNASEEALKQTVDKLMGLSEFKGVSPVDAFCDRWDTQI